MFQISRRILGVYILAASAACSSNPKPDQPAPARAPVPTAQAKPQPGAATRPNPYPVTGSPGFERAIDQGTRTTTGQPGPKYWQQWARYKIAADYDPATGELTGREMIRYFNRSPNSLPVLGVHLYDNLFAPGARRNDETPVVGPVSISRVAVSGKPIPEFSGSRGPGGGYAVLGTVMQVALDKSVAPGDSVDLEFEWRLTVPPDGAPRGGRNDGVAFVSYWYPQMAVYDDINGWQVDQYLGMAEFYMGYGDYEVELTVPAGYVIGATGTLDNPDEVLSKEARARLATSETADTVVHVIPADEAPGRSTAKTKGKLTWKFSAKMVRDFAWGVSDRFAWDATRAAVGNGQHSAVHTFWLPGDPRSRWPSDARYARRSVEFLSRFLWPYPYSQMTVVQGPESCGGMEYPMITCIGDNGIDSVSLYDVTVHEIGHMWFPMQVGSDEKRFAWMDEGLTQFDEANGMADFISGYPANADNELYYLALARSGGEEPLMRHGDTFANYNSYAVAAYMKPAATLVALRGLLGTDTFLKAYREYGLRWQWKHPTPWDFFNTFNDVTGQDLDWFWRTWFYETWTLDQAVGQVTPGANQTEIVIEDKGLAPMPAIVEITRSNGATVRDTVPVAVWLKGATSYTLTVDGAPVAKVVIDPDGVFPDINRGNNTWVR